MDPTSAANIDGLPPGTQLGRYEIRRLIGRGGMGSVYEALHRDLKKRVAIKTLLPALAANPDAKTRFLREGEAASRIRHPHVVDVTDVGAEGSVIYLVMEYLEGQDLGKLIASKGPLGITEAADIMLPVAAAIATAHDMGVIHRDLKPENIFLAVGAMGGVQPKVLDFGISKVTGDLRTMALTGTGATFGTTFYLPPEQLRGSKQADARSDQYALGTILYECLTGQRAFEGENLYAVLKDIAESRYRPAVTLRPEIPPALDAVVNRAMNLEPGARFESVHSLGAALLAYAGPSARMVWTPFFGTARPVREAPVVSPGFVDDSPNGNAGSRSGAISASPWASPSVSPSGPLSDRDFAPTPPPRPTTDPPARRITAGGTRVLPSDATPSPDGRSAGRPQRVESISTFRHATGESAMLRPRRSRLPLVVGLGVVAAIGAVFLVMRPDEAITTSHPTQPALPPPEPKMFRVELVTEPSTATIELDGQVVGTGAFARRLPVDGSEHEVVAHARGYRNASVRFTDTPPHRELALEAIAAPAEPAHPVVPVTETKPVIGATKPDKPGHGHHHQSGKPTASDHGGATSGGGAKPSAPKPGGKPRSGDPGLLPNNAPIVE